MHICRLSTTSVLHKFPQGFKIFLGITPTVTKMSAGGDEFSLILENNPLTEFVDLPPEHPKLLYSNVLVGAIRGALHNVSSRKCDLS